MSAQQCLKDNKNGTAPGSSRQELAENYEDDDGDEYKPLFPEFDHVAGEAVERIKNLEKKYRIPPSNHYMRAYALERANALERAKGQDVATQTCATGIDVANQTCAAEMSQFS